VRVSGVWLVLCERSDLPALWAYRGLRRHGLEPIELVTSELLAYSLRWEHRLDDDGVRTTIALADGRTIRSAEIQGILNRLVRVPTDGLGVAVPGDRAYATQELYALFLSWLRGVPGPVLNPPGPLGLCGPWLHLSEWAWLAGRAGLPLRPYTRWSRDPAGHIDGVAHAGSRPGEARTLLVVTDQVLGGPAPSQVREGCRRLSRLARAPLLTVDFGLSPQEGWEFLAAASLPDLTLGGESALKALTSALRAPRRDRRDPTLWHPV
jgi:hypothetical protein